MDNFEAKSLCILGRLPALGLAELESRYGARHVRPIDQAALLDFAAEDISFQRLGGTIKTARVLSILPNSDWKALTDYLQVNIPKHLRSTAPGKFTLGLSAYGLNVSPLAINRTMLEIKKIVKKTGRSVRVVPNKSPALSSAQVLHNKLTHKGAWELILIKDGQKTILAQTMFIQDIEAYAARDQARPARDPRVGMLPPKLAQVIINLALPSRVKNIPRTPRILDPFCGTGVILQEALLMGYDVLGTDIDARMVEYARANIQWLFEKHPELSAHAAIEIADATAYHWSRFSAVASELYLGPPLRKLPKAAALRKLVADTDAVVAKFLKNLSPQLARGQELCLAIPCWRQPNAQLIHLPVLAKLTDMGYSVKRFKHVVSGDLVYSREGQIVARQLLFLEKR